MGALWKSMVGLATAAVLSLWLVPQRAGAAEGPGSPGPSGTDPAAVVAAFLAAVNTGDAAGAAARFADTAAVVVTLDLSRSVEDDTVFDDLPGLFTGSEPIRGWIQRLVAQQARFEAEDEAYVDGARVTWRGQLTVEQGALHGGSTRRLHTHTMALVEDGRITLLTSILTPTWTSAYISPSVSETMSPLAVGPSAGQALTAAPPPGPVWLLALGALAGVASVVRVRRWRTARGQRITHQSRPPVGP